MTDKPNPFEAAIAELDKQIAFLQETRDRLVSLQIASNQLQPFGQASGLPLLPASDPAMIPTDAFFGMTIADAAVKFLNFWANRKPQNTNTIIDALEKGGLKRKNYTTVYGILNRRAKKEQDVVNVNGDWGLSEWYGGTKSVKRRIRFPVASAEFQEAAERGEEKASEPEDQSTLSAVV